MSGGEGQAKGAAARAWIDGAARGNPGPAGFGVLFEEAGERREITGYLGETTNNVAEYVALVAALAWAVERGVERLSVRSDSQLLVRQLEGAYKVRAAHLLPFFHRAQALRGRLASLDLAHVPRKQNKDADRLANRAIDERSELPDWLDVGVIPRG